MSDKIGIIGGDRRMLATAARFAELGYDVSVWGIDNAVATRGVELCGGLCEVTVGSDAIILPIPVTVDGSHLNTPLSAREVELGELFTLLPVGVPIYGGMVGETLHRMANERGIELYDYGERDEFAIMNALPTAEGAVAIAISEMPTTLYGSNAVVLGYGRVARRMCTTLRALGANVTALARKRRDFADMSTSGITAGCIEPLTPDAPSRGGIVSGFDALCSADVIFNTVPHELLTRELLTNLKKGVLVVDLASSPGGVDFTAARELGVNVVWARSLPGKTAPDTAGRMICDTVVGMLSEDAGKRG